MDTPIYVDKNIGGECGIRVAVQLRELGFTNIRLATGFHLNPTDVPEFIREISGKDFPAKIASLA